MAENISNEARALATEACALVAELADYELTYDALARAAFALKVAASILTDEDKTDLDSRIATLAEVAYALANIDIASEAFNNFVSRFRSFADAASATTD